MCIQIGLRKSEDVGSILTLPTPKQQITLVIEPANQLVLFKPRSSPRYFTCAFDQDQRRTVLCAYIERRWCLVIKRAKVLRLENHEVVRSQRWQSCESKLGSKGLAVFL